MAKRQLLKKNQPPFRASFLLGCFLLLSACATATRVLYPLNEIADKAKAGSYEIDTSHASVLFAVKHFGFSWFQGRFDTVSGSLNLDPKQPENSNLTADIAISSLHTGVKELDPQLLDKAMFDAANYKIANFTSTSVTRTGDNTANVEGLLTIKDIIKPITLTAEFVANGTNPLSRKQTIGFSAKGTIKRSDYNLKEWLPFVSDDVYLTIDVEFVRR